jgi:hypothetical protein
MKRMALPGISILLLLSFLAPAQSKPDKWMGTYVHRESGVKLNISGKNQGVYTAEFILGNQTFPAQGLALLGVFTGEYQYEGKKFDFSLTNSGDKWILQVDGTTINVVKNPLEKAAEVSTESPPQNAASGKGPVPSGPTPPTPKPSSGKRITNSTAGYSFLVPEGWNCKEENGEYKLTKAGEPVEILVSPHYYTSVQQAMAESSKPISDAQSNTYLTPVTKPYGNNGLQLSLNGRAGGQPLYTETISLFSPQKNGGVNFSAVSQKVSAETYLDVLKFMASGATFSAATQSPQAVSWQQKLTGRKLLYLKTEGGGTTKITIDLYNDGSYFYQSESSYASGGYADFSYADAGKDRGQWKIVNRGNDVILLGISAEKGGTTEYILKAGQNSGEVMLGNRRFFIQGLK